MKMGYQQLPVTQFYCPHPDPAIKSQDDLINRIGDRYHVILRLDRRIQSSVKDGFCK